jgi:hypothetical protein
MKKVIAEALIDLLLLQYPQNSKHYIFSFITFNIDIF